MTELTTERFVLRRPRQEDFPPLRDDLMSDRAIYVGGPFSEMGAYREFCMDAAGWTLHGYGAFSITDRATGALLGQISLNNRPDFPERELGWTVLPEHEGRGIAHEAAACVRDFAFAELKFGSLVSYIDPRNARSIALAERLGATRDREAPAHEQCDLVYRHPRPEDQ